jgi:hypothetical protein
MPVRHMPVRHSVLRNRQGLALPFAALMLFVLLGLVGLAVDLGFLMGARNEAQKVADAAALAGAGTFLVTFDEDDATDAAIDFAARNTIRGDSVVVLPEDVEVIADSQKVRVLVLRTQGRGNAIRTLFMRALGVGRVDVSASAAAQAFPAGAVDGECFLPFTIPDRWREADNTWPDFYDEFTPPADNYVPWIEDPENATGYSFPESVGQRVQIRGQQSSGASYTPSFWRLIWYWGGQVPGNTEVQGRIESCIYQRPRPVEGGDVYQVQPGNLSGPRFRDSFQAMINEDPRAYWEDPPGCNCVRGSAFPPGQSPRIRPLSLFDPRDPPQNGAQNLTISTFVNVFVESIGTQQGQPSVFVRFGTIAGLSPGDWGPGGGPVAYALRLVE